MSMELAGFPYLSAILLSCVAGLLVILFIPHERETLVKWVSLVFSGIALALSIYVFCAYDRTLGGLQFVEKMLLGGTAGNPLLQRGGRLQPSPDPAHRDRAFHRRSDHVGAPGTGQGVLRLCLRARPRRLRLLHEHGSLLPLCLVSMSLSSPCIRSSPSGGRRERSTGHSSSSFIFWQEAPSSSPASSILQWPRGCTPSTSWPSCSRGPCRQGSRSSPSSSFTSASGSSQASGHFIRGRPWAMRPLPLR